ncbi:MAG TPA: GNAT family N-acetyltransferase [Gemmatimonadaceae bacterium]|jgi:GNAT superfamily N-acetyltransferase
MIAIRPASPADADALAELRWEFRAPRAAQTESHDAFMTRCADWMRAELSSGRWKAWVALEDARIVGQAWMYFVPKIPNPTAELERNAYISNVYVTPGSRGGVGSKLLGAALDAAKSERVDSVVLWPTDRSRTLYMRHGFVSNGSVLTFKCG